MISKEAELINSKYKSVKVEFGDQLSAIGCQHPVPSERFIERSEAFRDVADI